MQISINSLSLISNSNRRAIEESLRIYNSSVAVNADRYSSELERQKIEELELEKALKLSLIEK